MDAACRRARVHGDRYPPDRCLFWCSPAPASGLNWFVGTRFRTRAVRLETQGGSACVLRGVAYPLSRSGHGENSAQGLAVQSLSQAPRRGFSPAFAPLLPREDRHATSGAAVSWPRRASALAVTHRRECGRSPTCCNYAGAAVALGSGWAATAAPFVCPVPKRVSGRGLNTDGFRVLRCSYQYHTSYRTEGQHGSLNDSHRRPSSDKMQLPAQAHHQRWPSLAEDFARLTSPGTTKTSRPS